MLLHVFLVHEITLPPHHNPRLPITRLSRDLERVGQALLPAVRVLVLPDPRLADADHGESFRERSCLLLEIRLETTGPPTLSSWEVLRSIHLDQGLGHAEVITASCSWKAELPGDTLGLAKELVH